MMRTSEWKEVAISEISKSIQYGLTSRSGENFKGPKYLRITDIQDRTVDWESVPHSEVKEGIDKYYLNKGDIVFARTGATVGKSYLINNLPNRAVFASYLIRIIVDDNLISPELLWYYFQSPMYWGTISKSQRGIGQPNVNGKILGQLRFIMPKDKKVQEEVVQAIETQFTRLDVAIKSLKAIKTKLGLYRKSILKRAFTPVGAEKWTTGTISQIVEIIDYRGRTPPFSKDGIPHLRSANIKKGKIVWDKLRYVSETTYIQYMTRGIPKGGDLLFTTEAPLGEIAEIPDLKFSLAQRIVLLRAKEDIIDSKFLLYQVISDRFQGALKGKGTGTTVTGVSSRNFKTIQLVFPTDVSQQKKIVEKIESQFSVIDKVESVVDASLTKANCLRKSILKSAFEGKLIN